MRKRFLLAVAIIGAVGCKTLNEAGDPNYAKDAEANLKLGNDALKSKSYPEAEKYFEYVKNKYPYLEVAKVAELRLADTAFEREKYSEARDAYKNFVKLHPIHASVDYAAFRAAMTHYKDIPSHFFLVPPAHEKDQHQVRDCLQSMTDFVKQYPNSNYRTEAQKIITETKHRLAQHEMYAAEFYAKRDKWRAVVGRLQSLLTKYSGAGYDEKALFELHHAYVKLKDQPKAEETLKRIIDEFPGSPSAAQAQKLLGS